MWFITEENCVDNEFTFHKYFWHALTITNRRRDMNSVSNKNPIHFVVSIIPYPSNSSGRLLMKILNACSWCHGYFVRFYLFNLHFDWQMTDKWVMSLLTVVFDIIDWKCPLILSSSFYYLIIFWFAFDYESIFSIKIFLQFCKIIFSYKFYSPDMFYSQCVTVLQQQNWLQQQFPQIFLSQLVIFH